MTTAQIEKKKKKSLFVLRRLPQVIELYTGLKRGNPPEYYASHLDYWLRNCAIPGESLEGYPDGNLLSREDVNIIKFSLKDIFGNFAFLYPRVSEKRAKKVARALIRASKILHDERKGKNAHTMQVVAEPKNYGPLHKSLLGLLHGSMFDIRDEKEIERLAEYFVIFCQGDRKILKELAIEFHLIDKQRDQNASAIPSFD